MLLLGLAMVAPPLSASTVQQTETARASARTQSSNVVLIDYRMVHEEEDAGADSGVSPDGQWISYSSSKSGNREIYAVHTETGEIRNLTNTPEDDWEGRWSPDGRKIVYTARRNGQNGVFILDFETGEETTVMSTEEGYEDYPSFSKDGRKISFTAGPMGTREVYTWDSETGDIKRVTRGHDYVGSTNFSADGTQVVYHAYYGDSYSSEKADIFIVDAEGGEGVNITHNDDVWVYKAQWSADGNWIAFSGRYDTPNHNIWVMRPDGSHRTKLTNVAGEDFRWADFTADGRLAWHGITPQQGRLQAVDVESGEEIDVWHGDDYVRNLGASPDGSQLVFESGGDIFLMDASPGSTPDILTEGTSPYFSDDGSTIQFSRRRGSRSGTIAVSGGRPTITEREAADPPESPDRLRSTDGRYEFYVANERNRVAYYITNESVTDRMNTAVADENR
jgi:TolB protein